MVFIFPHELISIHAPTRGATVCPKELVIDASCISIHAPTRGATRIRLVLLHPVFHFNPRSHEGSDISVYLSIRWENNFNPRSHEGSDDFLRCCLCRQGIFQSTLPRGERQQFSPRSSLFSQQKLSKIFNLNNKLF